MRDKSFCSSVPSCSSSRRTNQHNKITVYLYEKNLYFLFTFFNPIKFQDVIFVLLSSIRKLFTVSNEIIDVILKLPLIVIFPKLKCVYLPCFVCFAIVVTYLVTRFFDVYTSFVCLLYAIFVPSVDQHMWCLFIIFLLNISSFFALQR